MLYHALQGSISLFRHSLTMSKLHTIVTMVLLIYSRSGLDAALVGLALTYITSLVGMLQYAVKQSAEVENVVSTFQSEMLRLINE